MKKISGSTLKLIAIITMLIDHIAAIILNQLLVDKGLNEILISENSDMINNWINENPIYILMIIMRLIGRISFPIFCFLLIEGFYHTRDVKKYIIRLFMFAILSEIPFDLAFYNSVIDINHQNVFFTLLIGLLVILGLKSIENKSVKWVLLINISIITIGFIVAEILKTDYAGFGVLAISIMYLYIRYYNSDKLYSILAACIVLCMMNPMEVTTFLAILPIMLYNGKRGLNIKYFCYVFYPIHLFILWIIRIFI